VKKQRIAKSTKFGGCVENRRDKETLRRKRNNNK
jgi:hypothetical protein